MPAVLSTMFDALLPVCLTILAVLSPAICGPPTGAYSTYAANSAISRGQGNGLTNGQPEVNYPDGEFQWALRLLFERTGNQSYFEYIQKGVDTVVDEDGNVHGGYKYSRIHLTSLLI
jgi:rhamnogalacturonyl hydrolase YesR